MRIFKNMMDGTYWQFDDSDDIREHDGKYTFFDAAGQRLVNVPDTLEPSDPPPAPEYAPPPALMSTLTFFERFTDPEYEAVRTGPIAIQRGLDSLIAAQYVDLLDPRVEQYLDALVQAGIIDTERKAQLLEP